MSAFFINARNDVRSLLLDFFSFHCRSLFFVFWSQKLNIGPCIVKGSLGKKIVIQGRPINAKYILTKSFVKRPQQRPDVSKIMYLHHKEERSQIGTRSSLLWCSTRDSWLSRSSQPAKFILESACFVAFWKIHERKNKCQFSPHRTPTQASYHKDDHMYISLAWPLENLMTLVFWVLCFWVAA